MPRNNGWQAPVKGRSSAANIWQSKLDGLLSASRVWPPRLDAPLFHRKRRNYLFGASRTGEASQSGNPNTQPSSARVPRQYNVGVVDELLPRRRPREEKREKAMTAVGPKCRKPLGTIAKNDRRA